MFYRINYQPFIQAIQLVRNNDAANYSTHASDQFRQELFDKQIITEYVPASFDSTVRCCLCNKPYSEHGFILNKDLVENRSEIGLAKDLRGTVICPDDWIMLAGNDKYEIITDVMFNMLYSPILTKA